MNRAAACLVLLTGLASCASTARITGDFGDYRSYRQTRVTPTIEARLGASERYLSEFPHGDYSDEVRHWFIPAEKHYYKLAWNNLPRLRAYLDAMPRGPHAEAVTERIAELESRRLFADRRDQRMLERAQGIEARLAQAADQRRDFLHEFSTLTRLLGATRSFGEPTSELDSELLLRFRLRQPAGTCEGDRCSKVFTFLYAVPEDELLGDRKLEVTLQIVLDRGLVRELSLSGSELLTRVAEAVEVRAIPEGNPQARAEALAHALDIIGDALDAPLPKARCEQEPVSPIVLSRRCDGVHFEVEAGIEPGAPDRLSVGVEAR